MLQQELQARMQEERGKEKTRGNKGFLKVEGKKEPVTIKFDENQVNIFSH